VVTPQWLSACRADWRRVEEGEFAHGGSGGKADGEEEGKAQGVVDEVAAAMTAAGGGGGGSCGSGPAGLTAGRVPLQGDGWGGVE
jgi:hypothetical protein